ncbi:MAG: preprotein translocase subunit SecE [Candidatus Vogelbacteria bacterium]|nr:preprotein translocase subunit SecE [Candidatus Vogelbacteria bacterium]
MSIGSYLKETRVELKQVNWPTRRQTVNFTILVISFSFLVAALLGAFDFIFVSLLESVI